MTARSVPQTKLNTLIRLVPSVHASPVRSPALHLRPGLLSATAEIAAVSTIPLASFSPLRQGTVATRGEGLYEGLDWLAGTLKDMQRRGISTSVGGTNVAPKVK